MIAALTVLFGWQLSLGTPALPKVPVELDGSPASMARQHQIARENGFDFLATPREIRSALAAGELVRVAGNRDYQVLPTVTPFARPEVRLFVERFAGEYRGACGERLVVTSLTRPSSRQPRNAHPLSVHPAGMAIDLRVSRSARCRGWLEATLLELEGRGVLDATRERHPPHYHVAVFPTGLLSYLAEALPAVAAGPGRELVPAGRDTPEPRMQLATSPAATRTGTGERLRAWTGKLLALPSRIAERIRPA